MINNIDLSLIKEVVRQMDALFYVLLMMQIQLYSANQIGRWHKFRPIILTGCQYLKQGFLNTEGIENITLPKYATLHIDSL